MGKNCAVNGCSNNSDQGVFFGDYCAPCAEFIKFGTGVHSQAYRNRQAALAEIENARTRYRERKAATEAQIREQVEILLDLLPVRRGQVYTVPATDKTYAGRFFIVEKVNVIVDGPDWYWYVEARFIKTNGMLSDTSAIFTDERMKRILEADAARKREDWNDELKKRIAEGNRGGAGSDWGDVCGDVVRGAIHPTFSGERGGEE